MTAWGMDNRVSIHSRRSRHSRCIGRDLDMPDMPLLRQLSGDLSPVQYISPCNKLYLE